MLEVRQRSFCRPRNCLGLKKSKFGKVQMNVEIERTDHWKTWATSGPDGTPGYSTRVFLLHFWGARPLMSSTLYEYHGWRFLTLIIGRRQVVQRFNVISLRVIVEMPGSVGPSESGHWMVWKLLSFWWARVQREWSSSASVPIARPSNCWKTMQSL